MIFENYFGNAVGDDEAAAEFAHALHHLRGCLQLERKDVELKVLDADLFEQLSLLPLEQEPMQELVFLDYQLLARSELACANSYLAQAKILRRRTKRTLQAIALSQSR